MPFPSAFSFSCVICGTGREGLIPIHSRTDRGEVAGGEGKVVGRGRGTFLCLSFVPMLIMFHMYSFNLIL